MHKSKIHFIPLFSDFFNSQEPELQDLFDNPPINRYLCFLCSLNDQYSFDTEGVQDFILANLLKNQSIELVQQVVAGFRIKFSQLTGAKSIVDLMQYLLSNYSSSNNLDLVTNIDELNLFKAILIFNRKTYHETFDSKILEYQTLYDKRHTNQRKSLYPYLYAQMQFNTFGEHIYFITKTRLIFNELIQNPNLKELGTQLINESYFESYNDWMNQHLNIVHYWFQRVGKKEFSSIQLNKEYLLAHCFDLKMSQKEVDKGNHQLFINRPFYKRFEGEPFPLVHYFFLIKLLDNEIYFGLKVVNDSCPKESILVKDLRSTFAIEIMEKKFFRNVLKHLLPTPKYKIDFLDNDNLTDVSKPDAYVIKQKHHLLFEFKDSMTSSSILENNNFNEIYKNLRRNYATKGNDLKGKDKIQNKGIYQLLDFMKNRIILSSSNKNISVYPILVVTDDTLMTPGTRDFLNNIWDFEVSGMEFSKHIAIKSLVVVHLSTLLNLAFSDKRELEFLDLLQKYYPKVDSRNSRLFREKKTETWV
jgi:hypothetical protein